ncbi:glutathione S-transferase family protein [Paracoccus laeviglucosivorans]|uniref:Glutathione S-transferase n=1 Tax=Paracoccus laeviglucosivorans TaxID=1197861 RepID=A0A521AX98_9RHOB|nr:glutathione binding-like protein [Paracoccus laeviglucosivorans]SMO39160.1 glutathione S-transferase [Paracoccus laeviglucosivorans]
MLTLYHAPQSRSTSILTLLLELDAFDKVDIRRVGIRRFDGSGGIDPANPHPEGKVPYLVNGSDHVRERGGIMLYLTDTFPEAGIAPLPGDPKRGEYLSWLFWYQGVVEPLVVLQFAQISNPMLADTFRDYDTMLKRLDDVLSRQPWLLGDQFSAADLLIGGMFVFLNGQLPSTPAIDAWAGRVQSRPSFARTAELDG